MRLLLLVTPELRGQDVHQAQTHLRAHGYSPGPIDGIYGPSTAAAVRRFQRHRLRVDGVIGPETAQALARTPEKPRPPVQRPEQTAGTPGVQALQWLAPRLGTKEEPSGSNDCPISREFAIGRVPWCAETVSLAFKHGAGIVLGEHEQPWGYWPDRGFAYCPAMEAWLRATGKWRGLATPEPGWIVLYHFGHREAVHTGIVLEYRGGGKFVAREGNTGLGNDSNGGELMDRDRYVSQVRGFAEITRP